MGETRSVHPELLAAASAAFEGVVHIQTVNSYVVVVAFDTLANAERAARNVPGASVYEKMVTFTRGSFTKRSPPPAPPRTWLDNALWATTVVSLVRVAVILFW